MAGPRSFELLTFAFGGQISNLIMLETTIEDEIKLLLLSGYLVWAVVLQAPPKIWRD